ncbi:MAG: hypothetical protein QNJ31_07590 [Candidatus Caenarcaniphilales bacterium]|nr:hypothetical protein [Candidatus Caenarcaniphilales bacterium]
MSSYIPNTMSLPILFVVIILVAFFIFIFTYNSKVEEKSNELNKLLCQEFGFSYISKENFEPLSLQINNLPRFQYMDENIPMNDFVMGEYRSLKVIVSTIASAANLLGIGKQAKYNGGIHFTFFIIEKQNFNFPSFILQPSTGTASHAWDYILPKGWNKDERIQNFNLFYESQTDINSLPQKLIKLIADDRQSIYCEGAGNKLIFAFLNNSRWFANDFDEYVRYLNKSIELTSSC